MRIAFIHPDLGIGGAERLVVDAALGLQQLGHTVHIYTSYHDPKHAFSETVDGTLKVIAPPTPFPRAVRGKGHILFAHLRQLHLTWEILAQNHEKQPYDVFFVDQLSTCIPFLRFFTGTRVCFYCHFPDKLLSNGAFVEGKQIKRGSLLKNIYRIPMDWLEETTTRQSDLILANSKFTARIIKQHMPSIPAVPQVIYPGINLTFYNEDLEASTVLVEKADPDVELVQSDRPTLLSVNRFEKKKGVELAIQTFAQVRTGKMRLVIAGGYDPRVQDNVDTLETLIDTATSHQLTYAIWNAPDSVVASQPTKRPDVCFLLNFTTPQRTALLTAHSTVCLLYTPANEHFGIGPVEAAAAGLIVLSANSGGPTESIIDGVTGFLRAPESQIWSKCLSEEILSMSPAQKFAMSEQARQRAKDEFGREAMAQKMDVVLQGLVQQGRLGRWWSTTEILALLSAVALIPLFVVIYLYSLVI